MKAHYNYQDLACIAELSTTIKKMENHLDSIQYNLGLAFPKEKQTTTFYLGKQKYIVEQQTTEYEIAFGFVWEDGAPLFFGVELFLKPDSRIDEIDFIDHSWHFTRDQDDNQFIFKYSRVVDLMNENSELEYMNFTNFIHNSCKELKKAIQ